MREIDKAKAEQLKDTLRDDELDAVTGGAVDAFIWFEVSLAAKEPIPYFTVPLRNA